MEDRHARHRRPDADRRRRPSDGHRSGDRARFRRLVDDVAAGLPEVLRSHLDDVDLVVRDVPPSDDRPSLSHYEVARAEPAGHPSADRLTLFRRPLELRAGSKADLADLLRETLARELAQHLGIDDDDLEW